MKGHILSKVINKILICGLISNLFFVNFSGATNPPIPTNAIDCTNSTCTPNFTVNSNHAGSSYNAIDVGQNAANINVSVDSGQAPRNLRMNVFNGAFPSGTTNPGYSLNVNLSSNSNSSNSGNFILLGDNFANLDVTLNGYNGAAGSSASTICANNIKAGNYGADALSFFNNLRLNNPSISANNCVLDDINFLQSSKFSCPSGFSQILTSNSVYSVNVQRIPQINRCQTSLNYNVCLRRQVELSCEWTIFNGSANFNANLTAGTNQLSSAFTVTGQLNGTIQVTLLSNPSNIKVGQPVTAAGIPPSTTIVQINGSVLTLSQPATVNANGVPLLIGVLPGQEISGPGIPIGTNIASVSSDGQTISITNNATITNTVVALTSATPTSFGGNISREMPENEYFYYSNLMSSSDICNLHVAQEISNPSYVAQGSSSTFLGNTILGAAGISNATNFQGSLTQNSTQVVFTTLPAGIIAGLPIYGAGIQANTIIEAINNSIITLSAPATVTASNVLLLAGPEVGETLSGVGIPNNTTITAIGTAAIFTGTTTSGQTSISGITSTKGLIAGQPIVTSSNFGPNTFIVSVDDANDITLSGSAFVTGTDTITVSNSIIANQNLNLTQSNVNIIAQSLTPVVNPLFSNANSYAGCTGACFWQVTAVAETLTTPGLIGNQLAPGSDWQIVNTAPGQQCDDSTNPQTGFYSTLQSVNVNFVAYDPTSTACNTGDIVTYSGGVENTAYPAASIDPNEQAVWFYTGVTQEPDFGTQVLECSLGSCPVNSVVSDLTQSLDTITPTAGQNGTQQGTGLLMIYDAQNVSTSANVGTAGAGGQNDIIDQATTQVCAQIFDAASEGIGSDYAKNPLVTFDSFSWQALQVNASGNPGQQPVNNAAVITLWKKVDTSVRKFLQNELFSQ
jgi:hypothetical protein